jgi:hypothetical protein
VAAARQVREQIELGFIVGSTADPVLSGCVTQTSGGPDGRAPTAPRGDRIGFLNIRVTDIEAVYAEWGARGANFLTPPKQHPYETRCYIRDPDGHLIEVGQTTDPDGDWTPAHWPSSTPADEPR